MIDERFSIRYRIEIKKICADGTEDVMGDTDFIPTMNRNQAKLLLELFDIDIENADWFEEFKNKVKGEK